MGTHESFEAMLLHHIGALEDRISTLSVQIAGLHLRREAARVASDANSRDRWDEGMRELEAELSKMQAELTVMEKRFHSLDCGS